MNIENISEMRRFSLSVLDLYIAFLISSESINTKIVKNVNDRYEEMMNDRTKHKTKLRYWLGNIIKIILTYLGFGHAVSFETYKNYVDGGRVYVRVNAVNETMRKLNHDIKALLDSCYKAKELIESDDDVAHTFYHLLVNVDLSYINTNWLFYDTLTRCGIPVDNFYNPNAIDPSVMGMDPSSTNTPMYCAQIKQKITEEVRKLQEC